MRVCPTISLDVLGPGYALRSAPIVQHDLGEWLVAGHMVPGPLTRAGVLGTTLGKSLHLPKPCFPEMVRSAQRGHREDKWQNMCINQHLVSQIVTAISAMEVVGSMVCGADCQPVPFPGQNVMAQIYSVLLFLRPREDTIQSPLELRLFH